ncbi:MAG TPA: 4'-phosphopantetheinyl transferase superfamily protein [Polyangiaceae bacterium]
MQASVLFDWRLAHGRCVGVHIPEDDATITALAEALLAPEEAAFASGLAKPRRRTWIGGRIALREALARLGLEAPAVLADERGAPLLPAGIAGSVSHKEHVAVALAAPLAGDRVRLGVDVEIDVAETRRPHGVAAKVLADDEQTELEAMTEEEGAREVLLRFSLKESIYKAVDPFVGRYVGFREVSVTPMPDGTVSVRARLREGESAFHIEACWLRADGLVVTTARVTAP